VSVLTGIPVRCDVAMTGEITLRGEVLPIGGLKEKLLAAGRGGIKTVLIQEENVKDLTEIPDEIKNSLEIRPVRWIDQVLEAALESRPKALDEDKDNLNGAHATIMDFVQVMLGLGFLGTIAGLDQSFFAALGANGGGIEAVTASMGQFAKGLATALDTTLLGLGCGMTVTLLSLLVRSREERFVDLLHAKVSRHIDEANPAAVRPDSAGSRDDRVARESAAPSQPLLARMGNDVVTGRILRWNLVPAVKAPRFLIKVAGRGGNGHGA
jgi:hypothetical protein